MAFPKVVIYTTKTCGYCKATKEFFANNSVPYDEIDVGNDQGQARAMVERSGQMGVPVVIVGEGMNEKMIIGYDEGALTKALAIAA